MKIKLDFVTNSSSTVYLLYLPENYMISEAEIKEVMESDWYDDYEDDFDSVDDFKNELMGAFDDLKDKKIIWRDDKWHSVYFILREILTEIHKEFILFEIDVGPDSDQIEIVTLDKLKEIVAAEELKIMKGDYDATENQE